MTVINNLKLTIMKTMYWAIVKDIEDKTFTNEIGRKFAAWDCLDCYTIFENHDDAMNKLKEIYEHFYKIDSQWVGKENIGFIHHTKTFEEHEITITFRVTAIFTNI